MINLEKYGVHLDEMLRMSSVELHKNNPPQSNMYKVVGALIYQARLGHMDAIDLLFALCEDYNCSVHDGDKTND